MLKQFILGFLIIILNTCSAQKETTMKTFDIENFNKNKDHLNRYTFITEDSISVKQNRWQFGFEEIITKKGALISTYKKYYNSGKLKLKGDFFPNDFEKGTWKEYDEQGKLIKETNYDAPYKFTWEDILELLSKYKINLSDPELEIGRGNSTKGTSWYIVWDKLDKSGLNVMNIDGVTGEITRKSELEYPRGGEYETLPNMENE